MPDYNALICFLLKPLLAHPEALRVDFESNNKGDRLWIRVAFDPDDRERNPATLQRVGGNCGFLRAENY